MAGVTEYTKCANCGKDTTTPTTRPHWGMWAKTCADCWPKVSFLQVGHLPDPPAGTLWECDCPTKHSGVY